MGERMIPEARVDSRPGTGDEIRIFQQEQEQENRELRKLREVKSRSTIYELYELKCKIVARYPA